MTQATAIRTGTKSRASLQPGGVRLRVYANEDEAFLVWETAPIPGCRGFAVYRKVDGAAEELLDNHVGWREDEADPKVHQRPSTVWPFQTFTWSDFKRASGQHLSYRVVPMVGPDRKHLTPASQFASSWSTEVTASAEDPTGVLSAFFNRGIVASQWLARVLKERNASIPPGTALATVIRTKGDFTRNYLAGSIRTELLARLKSLTSSGGHLFAALYELNDPELICAGRPRFAGPCRVGERQPEEGHGRPVRDASADLDGGARRVASTDGRAELQRSQQVRGVLRSF
jgi:hypothetical protein